MKTDFKIMLVDDSPFMRQVLKGILSGAGYEHFVEFGDGQQCLDHIEAEKPDLLLLDIVMPKVTGLDVLKKLGGKWKVIVISAIGQDKFIEEAKQNGALDYIIKPFDEEQVLTKVKKIAG
jgi:two-component system chemotaxis response regulator CheY